MKTIILIFIIQQKYFTIQCLYLVINGNFII